MSPAPLFLLGMMGAGKTSVGSLLASRRCCAFIDLDRRIERLFARTIPALFAEGEAHFRSCERAALLSLLAEPGFARRDVVVATGGGIVVDARNLEAMAAVGCTIYLEADLATLLARLESRSQREGRPLLSPTDGEAGALARRLAELLAAREQTYRRAALIIDARGTPEEVVTAVLAALARDHTPT
ncbi:MAG: shikimate kinase [Myxococcales bacterium]|nr:shikimate kinase [Myxococcales bacterium]